MLKVRMQRVEKWLAARRAIEQWLFPFDWAQQRGWPLIGSPVGGVFRFAPAPISMLAKESMGNAENTLHVNF